MRVVIAIPLHLFKWAYPAPLSMSHYPIGPAYVVAALRAAGHAVQVADPNNTNHADARSAITESLLRTVTADTDAVLIGGLCTDYAAIREIIRWTRTIQPSAQIVLGGNIATHDAQFIYSDLKPDTLITGETETVISDVLAGRTTGVVHASPPDVAKLPMPAWDLFPVEAMLQNSRHAFPHYRYPVKHPRSFVVIAGRSCPFRCTFCVHQNHTPYRRRAIVDVVNEIKHWRDRYDANHFIIQDELFAPNDKALADFSALMYGQGVKWTFQTHCSANYKVSTLRAARDAGLHLFSYGAESASMKVLASMQKRATPERVLGGIQNAGAAGVAFGCNYIFGDPAETPQTLKETFRFFNMHCRDGLSVYLAGIQPYPGSKLYADHIKDPAAFYRTIDELRHHMAPAFPRKPWLLWLTLLSFLGGRKLWLRAAHNAQCPYCREPVTESRASRLNGRPQALPSGIRFVARAKNTWLAMVALWLFVKTASLVWPWYGHLASLMSIDPRKLRMAECGCSNCNRMFLYDPIPK